MDSTKQLFQGYSTDFVKWWKVMWYYEQQTDSTASNTAHSNHHIRSVQSSISLFIPRSPYSVTKWPHPNIPRELWKRGTAFIPLGALSCWNFSSWHYCIPLLNNVCRMLHMRKYEVNTTVLWRYDIVNHMSSEILNNYPKANQPQWFQVIIVNVSVYMCLSVGLRSIIPSLAAAKWNEIGMPIYWCTKPCDIFSNILEHNTLSALDPGMHCYCFACFIIILRDIYLLFPMLVCCILVNIFAKL